MEKLYTAIAHATHGREGHVETQDGVLKFDLGMPKSMGGKEDGKVNPEQLFACGYSACFGSAVKAIAKKKGHNINEAHVFAEVTIGKNPDGGFQLAVELKVHIPEVTHEQAQDIVEGAHQVCPYSKATRGNIDVKLTILDKL